MEIIALHGAGMRAGVWGLLAQELPLTALTLPAAPSIAALAAAVDEHIAGRAEKSVLLLGHSMGALVALEAARHPSVAAVVLIGAAARMSVHPDLLRQAQDDPSAAAALILKWGLPPDVAAAAGFLRAQMNPKTLFAGLSACHAYDGAALTEKPALVLAGACDKLVRAAASEALAASLPQSTFRLLADSGHMPMVEKPIEIARGIKAFMGA